MKKFILLSLILPFVFFESSAGVSVEDPALRIKRTYSEDDLAKKSAFKGGFINFGYWKNINLDNQITTEDRVKASEDLYKITLEHLDIKRNDRVLEVGCGRGYGCIQVAENYDPKRIMCIDITPAQIRRAKKIHSEVIKKNDNLYFKIGSSQRIPQPDLSYNKIFSVEAAQHFPSIEGFAKEAYRLLEKGGTLVIVAHFSTSDKGYLNTKKLLPTVAADVDRMIPINEVRRLLKQGGLHEVKTESIGSHVFKGFDSWVSQIEDVHWAKNIYQLYLEGSIDYYLITFKK